MSKNKQLTYKRWKSMKARCSAPSYNTLQNKYQQLGITVCDKWLKYEGFLEDMGECPEGMSLERKDVLGDYNKENCCWIPTKEQAYNKTTSLYFTIQGETKILKHWAEYFGIKYTTLYKRVILKGMDIVEAINYNDNVIHNGVEKTVKQFCTDVGLSYSKVITKKHRSGLDYVQILKDYTQIQDIVRPTLKIVG